MTTGIIITLFIVCVLILAVCLLINFINADLIKDLKDSNKGLRKELDINTNAIRGIQNEIDTIRDLSKKFHMVNAKSDYVFVKVQRKVGK